MPRRASPSNGLSAMLPGELLELRLRLGVFAFGEQAARGQQQRAGAGLRVRDSRRRLSDKRPRHPARASPVNCAARTLGQGLAGGIRFFCLAGR